MLTLYYKETCPFSQRVMQMAENLGVALELKDIESDAAFEAELMEKGGKHQTPFFVDSARAVSMYESNDIIEYIREHYAGTPAVTKPRIHTAADATCVACEG